ncbi:MAG: DUF481 domain-containing protein [Acidobacteria bacterium]|jgi:putative salt-induced outer membrane protein|nr:DUF481 domain-containing protein [Acidobacteriota bacterium]
MDDRKSGRKPHIILPAACLAFSMSLAAQSAPGEKKSAFRLRGEISYVKTSGNTDTESFAGKLDSARENPIHKFFFKGQYVYGRNSGREASNKLALDGRWEASLNQRFSTIVSMGYGRDKFSGYRFRVFVGPGLGYFLVKEEKRSLQLSLALNYYHDRFSVGERRELRFLTGKTLGKFEWRPRENFKFIQNLGHFISFSESGSYFVESETAAETRINRTLSIGVSYKANYQNRPPAPEIRRTDTTFLTTLIIDIK